VSDGLLRRHETPLRGLQLVLIDPHSAPSVLGNFGLSFDRIPRRRKREFANLRTTNSSRWQTECASERDAVGRFGKPGPRRGLTDPSTGRRPRLRGRRRGSKAPWGCRHRCRSLESLLGQTSPFHRQCLPTLARLS